jgi:hypothetical protein
MARSGQAAGEPPAAITARDSSGSAVRPRVSDGSHNMALALVALGMVRHVLRSRRFYEGVAVAVIALGSMRGISQESRANTMARLAAWNKREIQRLEHKAERLEHKVERRPARLRTPPSECGFVAVIGYLAIAVYYITPFRNLSVGFHLKRRRSPPPP